MSIRKRLIGLSLVWSSLAWMDSMSYAQVIGFNEKFAIAENRDSVLSELIPQTEPYFFYHCLHCQTTGKLAEARAHLDAWIAKFGINAQNQKMRTRQFILEYQKDSTSALEHLRVEFGFPIDHAAPRKDEAAELPTQLDPKTIDWTNLFRPYGENLQAVNSQGLWFAARFINNPDIMRGWIGRIDRPDLPGILDLIEQELKRPDSQGFGWANIHQQLTNDQLIELQKRIPKLIESYTYIQARLRRIRPSDDQSLEDPNVLRAHLTELEAFISTLPESQNSLLATVLYHRLELDEREGILSKERFLKYLQLPVPRYFTNADFIARFAQRPNVNLAANYQGETLLRAIGEDTTLIQRYLEHFFQTEENVDAFSPYLNRDYLRKIFATTKILYGLGDAKTYYAQLSPDEQRELQSRVEVRFASSNPHHYRPSDSVQLELDLKNTPELLVKIYQVNARNVLLQRKQPIGTDLDLDGLVANAERRITYTQPADRRHRESIKLPELQGGGVWIVDVMAGGLRSRTLINKGYLIATQRLTEVGTAFRVYDAEGKHTPNAIGIFGNREYRADDSGEIVIPFGSELRTESIVFVDGQVATVQNFVQQAENYELKAGFLYDPQGVLAGSKAKILIRPLLLCNGEMLSLARLEKPTLVLSTTDMDGIENTQTILNFPLSDRQDSVFEFLVPQRLRKFSIHLQGQVKRFTNGENVSVSAQHESLFNETSSRDTIADFYLSKTNQGYRLELRGRNGEPIARTPVQFEFGFFGASASTGARLATDANGIVDLGQLPNIEYVRASADRVPQRTFSLAKEMPVWPENYHALQGQTVVLPWPKVDGEARGVEEVAPNGTASSRLSLIEYRDGQVLANRFNKLEIKDGAIQIKGLGAGSYRITDHWSGQSTQILVVSGKEDGDYLVGNNKLLQANRFAPVHVKSVATQGDELQVQLENTNSFTRVHVLATAFEPEINRGLSLPSPSLPLSRMVRVELPNFYVNSMKLDEEYQYVMQRQFVTKYIGNLLPHPSVLLNPWELSTTNNTKQDAAAGDPLAALAPGMAGPSASDAAKKEAASTAQGSADYEFLKRGSLLLTNARSDDSGVLKIDRKLLGDLTSVTLVIVQPGSTTYRTVYLPGEGQRQTVDRRLAKAFPADDSLAHDQNVLVLNQTGKVELGEAALTRVKLYSSIADVYSLYRSVIKDSSLDRFECLSRWNTLSDSQKETYYADLACHEMHLFLLNHDADFFKRVVRPHLVNKMQKQFMDDYVLGNDLTKYASPWFLAKLNTVERVLLAKRLETQRNATKRWLKDNINVVLTSVGLPISRFEAALGQNFFADSEAGLAPRDGIVAYDFASAGGLGGGGSHMLAEQLEEKQRWAIEFDAPNGKDTKSQNEPEDRLMRAYGGRSKMLGKAVHESLYQNIELTRIWAESNYYRLKLAAQTSTLAAPNQFWLDYADHDDKSLFLSKHLDQAANNVHEALMALAVLGFPIEAKPIEQSVDQGKLFVALEQPTIAFVQGIKKLEKSQEPTSLLASQSIFLASDANADAKPVDPSSMIKGTVYRMRVVLTNTGASPVQVNLLRQIPQGAIPLENAMVAKGQKMELAPFATQELQLKFYFPQSGEFEHYGSQIASGGKVAISIPATKVRVLDAPESIDETSWAYVSAWGTNEQVLQYLSTANLAKINLDAIAWRMADRKFYEQCLDLLSSSGVFHPVLWGYAIKHNDPKRLEELLESNAAVVNRVGPVFNAKIMQIAPVERLTFEHLDFRPLIVARTHTLGGVRMLLNDGLAVQYNQFMDVISHQTEMDPEQRLSLVYYLIIQNRLEEAIAHFKKVERANVESQMQYDYFACYLNLCEGKYDEAETLAGQYVQYPVPRWRDWFLQVRSQIAERKALIAGKSNLASQAQDWQGDSSNRLLIDGREAQNADQANRQPVLNLVREGDRIFVRHRNLESVRVHFYPMNAELLFSRSPFAQQDAARLNMIEPMHTQQLDQLSDGKDQTIEIPAKLKNQNVGIEVVGGGLTQNLVIYSNSLVTNHSPNMGRLQVLTKNGLQPLAGAYVKVYARTNSGEVKFYKDGYSDLRGQFDYATVSTGDLQDTQRFAILVQHPENGTTVLEAEPPKR